MAWKLAHGFMNSVRQCCHCWVIFPQDQSVLHNAECSVSGGAVGKK